jgi:hypothetical protein
MHQLTELALGPVRRLVLHGGPLPIALLGQIVVKRIYPLNMHLAQTIALQQAGDYFCRSPIKIVR